MLEGWAHKRMGVKDETTDEAPPEDIRIEDLDIPEEMKAQLRAWGKHPPPVPGNPPNSVHDEGTWERAKKAVEKHWGNYSEPWAVVMHVYQNMGGT